MYVNVPNRDKPNSRILLKDVLYAPLMGVTLISINKIAGAGSTVIFTGNFCRIYNKNRVMIGEITAKGGLSMFITHHPDLKDIPCRRTRS